MRNKSGTDLSQFQIGKMMEEFGFNPNAATSTGRALILNLVRSAYGPDAAREFMRQMNLEKNRNVEAQAVLSEFQESRASTDFSSPMRAETSGVGSEETQLSLFDVNSGTFLQKKSRRA